MKSFPTIQHFFNFSLVCNLSDQYSFVKYSALETKLKWKNEDKKKPRETKKIGKKNKTVCWDSI